MEFASAFLIIFLEQSDHRNWVQLMGALWKCHVSINIHHAFFLKNFCHWLLFLFQIWCCTSASYCRISIPLILSLPATVLSLTKKDTLKVCFHSYNEESCIFYFIYSHLCKLLWFLSSSFLISAILPLNSLLCMIYEVSTHVSYLWNQLIKTMHPTCAG